MHFCAQRFATDLRTRWVYLSTERKMFEKTQHVPCSTILSSAHLSLDSSCEGLLAGVGWGMLTIVNVRANVRRKLLQVRLSLRMRSMRGLLAFVSDCTSG